WPRRPGSARERRSHRRGGAQGYGTGSCRNVIDAAMDALATGTSVLHVTAAVVVTLAGEVHGGASAVQRLGKLLRDRRLVGRGADGSPIRGGRVGRRSALARAGGRRLWHAHRRALLRGAAHVGDPERAVARSLARRALARGRGSGGNRVHGGRHP